MWKSFVVIFAGLVMFANQAVAAVVIDVVEINSDVLFSYEGTLDLGGQSPNGGTNNLAFGMMNLNGVGVLAFGMPNVGMHRYNYSGFDAFGTNTDFISGTATGTGLSFFGSGTLGVATSYVSNTALAGTLLLSGHSFTSLGLIDGIYIASVVSGDTIALQIGEGVSAVPLPAPLGLMLVGLAGLILLGWRKQ